MGVVGGRWGRLSIGHKVVAPFVGLSLVVGLLVSAAATQQFAASGAQQLQTLAVREQDNVNTVFNSIEEQQLGDLRLLAATRGVSAAVKAGDTQTLTPLLLPLVANHLPEQIEVVVINARGDRILQLAADPANPDQCQCSTGGGKASFDYLDDVLSGRADTYGTRYAGFAWQGTARLLYTIGPIIDEGGYLVGAVLVGETLDRVLAQVQDRAYVQLSLFGSDGANLATTQRLDYPIPTLNVTERGQVVRQSSIVSKQVAAAGHQAAIFYVPWVLRFEARGYAAIVVPADLIFSGQRLLVIVILIVGLGALGLSLLVGSIVTRSITRPMEQLIHATAEVAAGHLEHRAIVDCGDEIGHLAVSFNSMTGVLMERTARLERLNDEILVTLAAAVDARDPYTHGHSMRVSVYADALAAGAGFDAIEREAIKRGCMVHDIGKIGVPDRILLKADGLSDKERNEMQQHPVLGHRLVSGMPWNQILLDIVLHHHERWDGDGYPAGLVGEAIPRVARVAAIADTLDAMTSRRPYRAAFGFRRAADEIVSQAGRQFDPALIAVLKIHRGEMAALVEGALQAWVPRVVRKRNPQSPAVSETRLKIVSGGMQT